MNLIKQSYFKYYLVLALFAAFMLSGCAAMDKLSSQEKHQVIAQELMEDYKIAYNVFRSLEANLPKGEAQTELDKYREPMNDLKDQIINYTDLVLISSIEDANKKKTALNEKITQITMELMKLGIKYGIEVQSTGE